MGVTKSENFSSTQNGLAAIAKALGHPARIAIIQHLLTVDSCICGDIVKEIPLTQPTVSKHLKELKTVGLIKGSIDGVRINYCIDGDRWREIQFLFNELFDAYQGDQNCDC